MSNYMNIADEQDLMVAVSNFLRQLEKEGRLKRNTRTRVTDVIMQRRLEMYQSERQDLDNDHV